MSNNVDLVNDALSLIGVLPSGQTASAEDGEIALRTVDEMVDEWAEDGVTVNWSPQANLGDECSLMGGELTAVKYHLAIRLCPHFGRDPSQPLMALAANTYSKIQRKQMVQGISEIKLDMPQAEAGWPRYNIITDTF